MKKVEGLPGLLVLTRIPEHGKCDIIVNQNLLVRVVRVSGDHVRLGFKDLDPKKYNMIERREISEFKGAIDGESHDHD